jgi:hypothetical protein
MTSDLTQLYQRLQQSRRIDAAELNQMSQAQRLDVIRHARGKAKYDMLLDARDAEELAPLLHPQEIYLTISEIGPEYAAELLMLASTEQITSLIDLDCWESDVLEAGSTLKWLALLQEAGPEKACRTLAEMDPELVVIMLKKFMHITAGLEAYDSDDDNENANRLEGIYNIDYISEEAAKIVGGLLKTLQQEDQLTYVMLMESTRSELDSVLEEQVYQQRCARLLDFGFVPPLEARSLYTLINPQTFQLAEGKNFHLEAEGLPSPLAILQLVEPAGLLAATLAKGLSHELATELCLLANRKMAADRVDISRETEVRRALEPLYHSLNLGLEYLSQRDTTPAAEIFARHYLSQIFQVGHSLIQRLVDRARMQFSASKGAMLDEPCRQFLAGLQQQPPVLSGSLVVGQDARAKAISTLEDLSNVERVLTQIEAQQQLFEQLFAHQVTNLNLTNCNIDNHQDLELAELFLTALANQLLTGQFELKPVLAGQLPRLHDIICENQLLKKAPFTEIRRQFEADFPACRDYFDSCLKIWQENLCLLDPQQINPRFIRGLIVQLTT